MAILAQGLDLGRPCQRAQARKSGARSLVLPDRHGLLQAVDRGAHGGRRARGEGPAAAGHGLLAGLGLALPDAARDGLQVLLAAEAAHVPGALLDLVPLHDLAQGRAVARAVLAGDANLLRALGHGSDAICPSLGTTVRWS